MLQNPNRADVRPGDEIDGFYLLTDATVRTSSNGSRYLPRRCATAAAVWT